MDIMRRGVPTAQIVSIAAVRSCNGEGANGGEEYITTTASAGEGYVAGGSPTAIGNGYGS